MRFWLQKEGPSHRRFTNCRNIWRLLRPGNLLQTVKVTIHIFDCISVTGGRFFCKKSSVLKFCLKLMYIVLYKGKTHFSFRFPQLQFDYKDPEKNFDRSKVHGLVCKLIKIKDVKMATALEVSAGGKVRVKNCHWDVHSLSLSVCLAVYRVIYKICFVFDSCTMWLWTQRWQGRNWSRRESWGDGTPSSPSIRSQPAVSPRTLYGEPRTWYVYRMPFIHFRTYM